MFCCISNCVPHEPVVSRSSGCLYERSLIEKYIAEHGCCPITGEALHKEDLIAVRRTPLTGATFVADETVPALLAKLHSQWDAIMLEQFALRQQLTQTQQELAQALHQYEAACRVIATFLSDGKAEEDTRVVEQTESGAGDGSSEGNRVDEERIVLPGEVVRELEEHDSAQRQRRRTRSMPTTLATLQCVQGFTERNSVHLGRGACGVSRLVCGNVFVGLDNAAIIRCDVRGGQVQTAGVGHEGAVRHVVAMSGSCGDGNTSNGTLRVISGSDDASLRFWASEGEVLVCQGVVRHHKGGIVGLRSLTSGRLFLSASSTEVGLVDAVRLDSVVCVNGATMGFSRIISLDAHPYGALAAIGVEGAGFCIWSTAYMCVDTTVSLKGKGDVCSIAFNGDCFTLATGLRDGKALLWDLRNLSTPFREILPEATALKGSALSGAVCTVAFDDYGKYLAVGGCHTRLYDWAAPSEGQQELCTLNTGPQSVAGILWDVDAQGLVSCSVDGVVKEYRST
ncbi:PRP19-like protein, putative [Trypanosoma equiperdum]|uniref:Pre-mRNA-processing factor 19 n=2 Tax=Trypanozoon TaxID=39700 RepID=Q585U7_TRYB2|nr:hypothetical protein, conserved [Trypanosoma brucei brucei TREU927]AAQ15982.1 hypothetical protein, conserved [Trypanosoma brucei brucei TREU927]AAX80002.1 hypothetical protein, conserved [Trypanosoma brucei]SCU71400.1 PRP19-like protein, putative [Trypanosoma equiperdum]